jgi:PAS domain S-box-containing protein
VPDRTVKLQESEARYRSLFNSMPGGFALREIITDADGRPADYRFLEVNPAFERLIGLSRGAVVGKTVLETTGGKRWIERYGKVALTGEPAHLQYYSSALRRWYEVFAYQPKHGQCATIFTDITERKQAEEALLESQEMLNRAQEIAHLGSWELDLINNELTWSDEVYRIFGLEPQEFGATYEAFLAHVHPDDHGAVNMAYSDSIREKRDEYEIEHRVVRSRTGEIRWVHEKCRHVRDADGQILRSLGMVLDITERKQAEEEMRRLSHFPEENPNPVIRCSTGGKILYTNAPARQWLATFNQAIDGGLPAPVREIVLKAHEAHRRAPSILTEITNPAGRTFGITALQPPGETYVNLYAVDLTDRVKVQADLEQSNRELEQFAYVASHDLQEPLRAIVGFLQLLQTRYDDQLDDKGRHFIERAVKAGHRLQTLIRELLTLSRVNSKGTTFAPTDLNPLVQNVLDNLQAIIREKNAAITCGRLPILKVDAGQIRGLFQNLIMNALQYNENPAPRIEIGFDEEDSACHFYVKDNGLGIAPQFHERIFVVFKRLHTAGEYPGTGLGLALCKKIVERHGGKIWVESRPQEGSTFHFTLPKDNQIS